MKRWSMVLGLGLAGVMAAPHVAHACMHGRSFRPRVDPAQEDVRRAEQLLARGDHAGAVRLARRAFSNVERLEPATSGSRAALHARAQRVAALAAVRSEGAVGPDHRPTKARKIDRSKSAYNVAWATFVLQFHAALEPDNTVRQAEYAEALAATPFMSTVAFAILHRLAEDDLMPTARGYALLARLQKDRGDESGLAVSLARCKDITQDAGACGVA